MELKLRDEKYERYERCEQSLQKLYEKQSGARLLTKESLLRLLQEMLDKKYSIRYTLKFLNFLIRNPQCFVSKAEIPSRTETRVLSRSIREYVPISAKKLNTDSTKKVERGYNISQRSDGRLTFTAEETAKLLEHAEARVLRENETTTCRRLALVWILMHYSGKRLSDISTLSVKDLEFLIKNNFVAIRIPKSQKVGRITLDNENFRTLLSKIVHEAKEKNISFDIPFDVYKTRSSMNDQLAHWYAHIFPGKTKPRGLGIHALRRRVAGLRFLEGDSLDSIRERLDHSNNKQTNAYINAALLEISSKNTT